jgi:three-Cys-motif partner protein
VATKPYNWADGAVLEDHSKRKHKILAEYFRRYLLERCKNPISRRFRLAIVDAFAGAGQYKNGEPGSPLIFARTLIDTLKEINLYRQTIDMPNVEIQCLLILNDADSEAISLLKVAMTPWEAAAKSTEPSVVLQVRYLCNLFSNSVPEIEHLIRVGRLNNVIYNLDQCGHSHVERSTISRFLKSHSSVEVFCTYSVQAMLAFVKPEDVQARLGYLGLNASKPSDLPDGMTTKKEWLGGVERLAFDHFMQCAPFVSPFSIHNPAGWRYWLLHLANSYRARQVYNDVLHDNSSQQAHFGRAGLRMLAYSPSHEDGSLYLFNETAREAAKAQLLVDIPRMISEFGDTLSVSDFYLEAYNETPAHSDDIHAAILDNPDLEVITPAGGERRRSHTISLEDTIRLKRQLRLDFG